MVGGLAVCGLDVGVRIVAVLQAVEQGFGVAAEVKAEVVDEFEFAVFVQAGVGGHFGVGGAAMEERAAAVVADAANDGGANAGGTDDAMRFAANGGKGVFEFVEGGAGQGDGLFAVFDEADAFQAARGDEDDRAVVVAVGGGTAGEAGVACLHDDDEVVRDAGFGDLPELVEGLWLDDGKHVAFAVADAFAVGRGFCRVGDGVAFANDGAEVSEGRMVGGWFFHGGSCCGGVISVLPCLAP